MQKIAIVLTCFNRKEKTLNVLQQIADQRDLSDYEIDVFLVDDGSLDGTAEAVRMRFQNTKLLCGDGGLFWCGGMRYGMEKAIENNYDFYVWLNDDTDLEIEAIKCLLETYKNIQIEKGQTCIIIGAIRDPATGEVTYSGLKRTIWWHNLKFVPVVPNGDVQECDTFNANLVLISKDVVDIVGNLDAHYTHALGDFDYGLKARQKEVAMYVAPEILGSCPRNSKVGTWEDSLLTCRERLRRMLSVKGLPMKERKYFLKTHANRFWYLIWLGPFVKLAAVCFKDYFSKNKQEELIK